MALEVRDKVRYVLSFRVDVPCTHDLRVGPVDLAHAVLGRDQAIVIDVMRIAVQAGYYINAMGFCLLHEVHNVIQIVNI